MNYVKVYRQTKGIPIPKRATDEAAGFDLAALIDSPLTLEPFVPVLVPTGIHIAMPKGAEAQVRPRSRLSRAGILVFLGTIDSDYRGEIFVTMMNLTRTPYEVDPGDRVGQLVFAAVVPTVLTEVEDLDSLGDTDRGFGGFGSTGR